MFLQRQAEGRLVPSGRLAAISGVAILSALVLLAVVGAPRQLGDDLWKSRARGPSLERPLPPNTPVVEQLQALAGDTDSVWRGLQGGYSSPKLVFFENGTDHLVCGFPASAAGPFYCPTDKRVYVDLAFVNDLKQRHEAQSGFAFAYLVAHEVGHHIQNLSGVSARVAARSAEGDSIAADQLTIRQELQADCLAGVWAHHSGLGRQGIGTDDIEAGLAATTAVGGETLQKRNRGYVVPEDFSVGTSLQRADWFRRGLSSGQTEDCNAFEAMVL